MVFQIYKINIKGLPKYFHSGKISNKIIVKNKSYLLRFSLSFKMIFEDLEKDIFYFFLLKGGVGA